MSQTRYWRSLLFMANYAHAAKAGTRGADAIILDLEDGIAPDDKPQARAALAETVATIAAQNVDVMVRINAPWLMALEDLAAAVLANVCAIVVPKAEDGARLAVLSEMISEMEWARGLAEGSIALIAQIESPQGLNALDAILSVPRVVGAALGPEDFSLALGVSPSPTALRLPTEMIALAAARAAKQAFAMPISIAAYQDLDAWADAARTARAMGATGAMAIHPAQIAGINENFKPSAAEVAQAQAIVDAWNARDGKAVITLGKKMIDRPVVEQARRLLGLA